MIPWSALHALRIGCVQYLNAKPLIDGYDGEVVYDHPSTLAIQIARGELDAGLVPIFEALRAPHYALVDRVAIACDGPVFSVFLAHRGPLQELRTIALDPGSLTSVHLVQVILAEFYQLRPRCLDHQLPGEEADGLLLIGNQAIDFRLAHPNDYQFLDLGEEWKRRTGLPFVFALWMLREGLTNQPAIAEDFRALQSWGVAHIAEIVERETFRDAPFRRRYLTEHIRFRLGETEKRGIERFGELLVRHGFLREGAPSLRYV